MRKIPLFILAGTMIISACHSKQGNKEEDPAEILKEYVRPASSGGTSAAYFNYTNTLNVADTVRSVNGPFAGISQIHETYKTEDGMMGMREQNEVVIQPGETLSFKQGGLHVMLMRLEKDLVSGDSVIIQVELAKAGLVSKKLPVQP